MEKLLIIILLTSLFSCKKKQTNKTGKHFYQHQKENKIEGEMKKEDTLNLFKLSSLNIRSQKNTYKTKLTIFRNNELKNNIVSQLSNETIHLGEVEFPFFIDTNNKEETLSFNLKELPKGFDILVTDHKSIYTYLNKDSFTLNVPSKTRTLYFKLRSTDKYKTLISSDKDIILYYSKSKELFKNISTLQVIKDLNFKSHPLKKTFFLPINITQNKTNPLFSDDTYIVKTNLMSLSNSVQETFNIDHLTPNTTFGLKGRISNLKINYRGVIKTYETLPIRENNSFSVKYYLKQKNIDIKNHRDISFWADTKKVDINDFYHDPQVRINYPYFTRKFLIGPVLMGKENLTHPEEMYIYKNDTVNLTIDLKYNQLLFDT